MTEPEETITITIHQPETPFQIVAQRVAIRAAFDETVSPNPQTRARWEYPDGEAFVGMRHKTITGYYFYWQERCFYGLTETTAVEYIFNS